MEKAITVGIIIALVACIARPDLARRGVSKLREFAGGGSCCAGCSKGGTTCADAASSAEVARTEVASDDSLDGGDEGSELRIAMARGCVS